jgi:ketosteroid isomerase-like protein
MWSGIRVGALAFACAMLTACAPASGPEVDLAAEESAVRELIVRAFEAEREVFAGRESLESVLQFYAAGAVGQAANMPELQGLDALREYYTEYFSLLMVTVEGGSNQTFVASSGDLAFDIGWNRMVLNGPEGPVEDIGKYLCVLRKVEGEWKIVAISSSSDSPM